MQVQFFEHTKKIGRIYQLDSIPQKGEIISFHTINGDIKDFVVLQVFHDITDLEENEFTPASPYSISYRIRITERF